MFPVITFERVPTYHQSKKGKKRSKIAKMVPSGFWYGFPPIPLTGVLMFSNPRNRTSGQLARLIESGGQPARLYVGEWVASPLDYIARLIINGCYWKYVGEEMCARLVSFFFGCKYGSRDWGWGCFCFDCGGGYFLKQILIANFMCEYITIFNLLLVQIVL